MHTFKVHILMNFAKLKALKPWNHSYNQDTKYFHHPPKHLVPICHLCLTLTQPQETTEMLFLTIS